MNLEEYILQKKEKKSSALYMPYLTLGDPDFQTSYEISEAILEAGSDLLELGIPFSDPTADGPVIQKAMVRAMSSRDFSLENIFRTTAKIHQIHPQKPLVYLTYFNIVYQYNHQKNSFIGEYFIKKALDCGISGLVIPDLPFDSPEQNEIRDNLEKSNIDMAMIPMISPNTTVKRMKKSLRQGKGFVYYITSLGVTGIRDQLPEDMMSKISEIRSYCNLPIFAGFGISKFEQASVLKNTVDGIIVGSLNHKIIEEDITSAKEKIFEITKKFIENLKFI